MLHLPRSVAVLATATAGFALAVTLAGCSSAVSLHPAPGANDPACADITVHLPETVNGQDRRWTDAQATGAWGDPASVILTCGLTPPGPTTLPCRSVDGVDWIIDDTEAPHYRVTTFGRVPAVEVYLDNDVVSSADVLDTLSRIVAALPADGAVCTDAASTTP